jgi:hypothetical protein
MPAGAMREGRQSAHVSMAGQEQGSRRATARREERGTEGGARINSTGVCFGLCALRLTVQYALCDHTSDNHTR